MMRVMRVKVRVTPLYDTHRVIRVLKLRGPKADAHRVVSLRALRLRVRFVDLFEVIGVLSGY